MRKEVVVTVAAVATAVLVVAVATITQYKRKKEKQLKKTQRIVRKFARECATPVAKLLKVANALASDMETSLAAGENTTLDMLVSYATSLPNGDEKGQYYGLNLRGNNFLILCARLGGKDEPITDLHREEISIPSNLLLATSQELFDYVAVELAKFVAANPGDIANDGSERMKKLGVTVSYPVDQIASTSGSAIQWKTFSADDTVGKALLNDINGAIEKQGLNMQVFAMVDETVGNLGGGRYYNKDTVAAVTLASTTNAAYVEPVQAISKWHGPSPLSGEMAISMEWGNFNCAELPITEFDATLDSESSNPGTKIFEKMISATYLGEIVRRVLLKIAKETSLFGDHVPTKLAIPFLLSSPDMAAMHQDASDDRGIVGEKLQEIFGIADPTLAARAVVAEVCDIVAERGARLAGAGIVGIIKKLGRVENKKSVVSVEGGLYEHYRVFRNYLHSSVWEILGNEHSDNVLIEPSHGGSGAGALFLAACQTHNPDS
ncbi:probable hexokinase-like 2 protein [Mercurialis annua]|uniref:probable hexokinase-like 2 protein n=1 Tax=Mercurialis annua TaxID=3986 RepID=UPI00215E7B06|nr:probable hexokinase-like 2 protein [Mercurialis annua]